MLPSAPKYHPPPTLTPLKVGFSSEYATQTPSPSGLSGRAYVAKFPAWSTWLPPWVIAPLKDAVVPLRAPVNVPHPIGSAYEATLLESNIVACVPPPGSPL